MKDEVKSTPMERAIAAAAGVQGTARPTKPGKREALIQQKVNAGLTREQAIEVIERQEREDGDRAKAAPAGRN